MTFWDKKEAKRLLQKLPFYDVLIKNPHIKYLTTYCMNFHFMMN